MFYLVIALLALASGLLLAAPFLMRGGRANADEQHAAEVYRAQLKEVENDVSRGAITQAEAGAARAEIARRLISAQEACEKAGETVPERGFSILRLAPVLVLPLVAVGLYWAHGRPDLAMKTVPTDLAGVQGPEQLVAIAEARMRENPQDARGWDILGRAYMSLGRFQDAGTAFERAIRHGGETDSRLASLAETRIILADGDVTVEARALLERALALNPDDPKSLSFIGLADEQADEVQQALLTWQKLAALEGIDPRYRELANARIAALQPVRGPSEQDIEAAQNMDAATRDQFIATMVEGLKSRLETEGGSVAEWKQLIRAQVVLGRLDEAERSLAIAIGAHANESADIESFAEALGLGAGQRQEAGQ